MLFQLISWEFPHSRRLHACWIWKEFYNYFKYIFKCFSAFLLLTSMRVSVLVSKSFFFFVLFIRDGFFLFHSSASIFISTTILIKLCETYQHMLFWQQMWACGKICATHTHTHTHTLGCQRNKRKKYHLHTYNIFV